MREKNFWLIFYAFMVLRIVLSFISFFDVLVASILVSVLDALDGFFAYMVGFAIERKHVLDYLADAVSRLIFFFPVLMTWPSDLIAYVVLMYIWYYVSVVLRVWKRSYLAVAFTAPMMFIFVGVEVLPMFGFPLFPFILPFLVVGIIYNNIWHLTFYPH